MGRGTVKYCRPTDDEMAVLDDRQRFIIEKRTCETPWTLEAVGDALGLSRERVRQLEARGLAAIRQTAASGQRRGT